ncbi:MAG: translation initiation factor IF-2, partial [Planctomycetes bacterium]|nr:translation initiation factor IF-2 [Planctomycetota bacterium]
PAKLKGPRVVRVEKADYVAARPRRKTATGAQRTRTPEVTPSTDHRETPTRRVKERQVGAAGGEGSKKTRRRSPRHRGGRTGDSGEKLKEWRDRDLVERSERLAAAGGGHRRARGGVSQRRSTGDAGVKTGPVEVDEPITVKNLSAATGVKSGMIIRKLMAMDIMATVNQVIDTDVAEAIAGEYGIDLVVRKAKTAEEELADALKKRPGGSRTARAPVVTFLGHVDHGKTSLLDYIRRTAVAKGEAGGITQHIGAYRYDQGGNHVVFLDTPGHEIFTAMRARGANVTDVVVLVVAADDGVMPQTVEAINHAKAAGVPLVVALNKIDVPNANIQRTLGQLAEHGLQPREWGGDTEVIHTSAETGEGIDLLVETLSLEAELLELTAETDAPASGYVIEAQMKPGLGVVARLLVVNGTLHSGDMLLAGTGYGRVRRISDSQGKQVSKSGPATLVEVSGLNETPEAGDKFVVVDDIEKARGVAQYRAQLAREELLSTSRPVTLEGIFSQIEAGDTNELPVIIRADVQGSVEALRNALEKLSTDDVRLNILHAGVGGVTIGDVRLAEASGAIIIAFNVVADASARREAEAAGVDIRFYRVVYEIIEDIRRAMEEGLEPEIRQETVGHAEIRQVYKISRLGKIAGCIVTDGIVQRNAEVRIIRDNTVIEDGRSLDSLKRFKDDAREVRAGMECGIKIIGYDDVKEGDILEFYRSVKVARTL